MSGTKFFCVKQHKIKYCKQGPLFIFYTYTNPIPDIACWDMETLCSMYCSLDNSYSRTTVLVQTMLSDVFVLFNLN